MTQTGNNNGTALVTGAARRIGAAIAQELAHAGYAIALHTREANDPDALRLRDTLHGSGTACDIIDGDLADRNIAADMIERVAEALGPVTLLVNNASLFEPDAADDFSAGLWDAHMRVNLETPLILARDMARNLPDDREGSIVNIIDQRVWRLNPNFFTYTLSKSALWTATQTMAQAFAPRIRVNAIGPGPTLANERQTDGDFHKQVEAIPLQRSTDPADIARAVVYLAGARSVTGQMLALDGGQHLAWETPDIAGINE